MSKTKKQSSNFLPGYTFRNLFYILLPSVILTIFSGIIYVYSTNVGNFFGLIAAIASLFSFILLKKRKRFSWNDFGIATVPLTKTVKFVGIGLIYFLVINQLIGLFEPLAPVLGEKQNFFDDPNIHFSPWILFLFAGILVPIFEEILFRGVIFGLLGRKFGFVVGALISSIIFGLLHGQINVGIATFFYGLYLCYVVVKTRSLIPGMIIHILNNIVGVGLILIVQTLS